MKKLLSFFVFFITFFALPNNANSVEQITYKDKKYEKLDFKEYGNFFGIKKNNNFYYNFYQCIYFISNKHFKSVVTKRNKIKYQNDPRW